MHTGLKRHAYAYKEEFGLNEFLSKFFPFLFALK